MRKQKGFGRKGNKSLRDGLEQEDRRNEGLAVISERGEPMIKFVVIDARNKENVPDGTLHPNGHVTKGMVCAVPKKAFQFLQLFLRAATAL